MLIINAILQGLIYVTVPSVGDALTTKQDAYTVRRKGVLDGVGKAFSPHYVSSGDLC